MKPAPGPPRAVALALLAAVALDAIQWLALPVFIPGFASPANDVLDVVAALVFTRWFGWHWAFLPAFVAELIPVADIAPFWTLAVWFVAWRRSR
jgi:hypothetical protein